MQQYRVERDSMGEMRIPAQADWGAQTQRSLENFRIGTEHMPLAGIYAMAHIKKAAALTNADLHNLPADIAAAIAAVCDEILSGALDDQFPLKVWQTGSGTQSNMNVNEVIAHRAAGRLGKPVHPNDHVNRAQSSNDVFPAAMHIAAVLGVQQLLSAAQGLTDALQALEEAHPQLIKIGRTHLQDAVPLRFAQEVSAWRAMVQQDMHMLRAALPGLYALALGGTAVGTGLNAPKDFDIHICRRLQQQTGQPFCPAENKFQALTSKNALVFAHGALKALAADLMKIANDIRLLSSGPRSGIGELSIPENEPGSSIMPGKVNPTQCEMITMIACQVMGNDACIGFAASQGNFQLNVFMPVLLYNFMQSVTLLRDGVRSFAQNCVQGIVPNEARMQENLARSLMLVTALSPHLGYDTAARIAHHAHANALTLQEAAWQLCGITAQQFAAWVRPEDMV